MPTKTQIDSRVFRILALAGLIAAIAPGRAAAEEAFTGGDRFGDSTWVAPVPQAPGDPATEGPRVAEPDHERTWETVLRTPFRVAFFPFRLIGWGLQGAADLAEKHLPVDDINNPPGPPRGIKFAPQGSISNNEGLGLGFSVKAPLAGPENRFRGDAIWTTRDTRRARATATFGADRSLGFSLFGLYQHRPNRRFYGIGNDAGATRTIYLEREDRFEAALLYVHDPSRLVADAANPVYGKPAVQARGFAGLSDIDIGPGYNDTPRAVERFTTAEVPFLTRGTRVGYVGVDGAWSSLNEPHDPAQGVQVFGEARHVMDADASDLTYEHYRIEGRGYLPVLSHRRILAGRAIFEGVNPGSGSDPIPFYRLPESNGLDRFAGYSGDRFRDHRLTILEAQYRWLIWSKLWAFALAQRTEVAPSTGALRWASMHEAYGGGLRYRITDSQTAMLELAKGNRGLQIELDLEAPF